ncbi:polysaccharide pyruvyl transferase family protein [Halobacterium sp. MBLA0001]|uniref:polysaccharide pyruvyl transferase family protein n=1 Tax=Halobacterium sp. MBLA0001 TaxID=3413511 RepID=UPI003C75EA92
MTSYILEQLSGNVLLVGGYGVGNVGDEAILTGLLKDSSNNIDEITVVTHDERETEALHRGEPPETTTLNAIEPSPAKLGKELFRNDHFVFGGGGLFSHYMGPYAKKIPYYAMAAKTLGKSIHWTAIGVYSSTPEITKKALKFAMNQSDTVSVRDPISKAVLSDTGVCQVTLVDDPATKLQPDRKWGEKSLYDHGIDPEEDIFAIAARRVKDKDLNEQLWRTYRYISHKAKDLGYKVVFIPFCRHSYESLGMDHRTCESLSSSVGDAPVISYNHPNEALSIVSAMDGILATRLHSMIFAYVSSTPFVAIEYADKVTSLLKHYGKETHGVPLKDANSTVVEETVDDLIF